MSIASRTDAVRRFNRFYTRRIGVLHESLAATRFELPTSPGASKYPRNSWN